MLSQDLLSRIINVQWPGGLMAVLWAGAFGFKSGPTSSSPADPAFDVKIKSSLPWLGWSSFQSISNNAVFSGSIAEEAEPVFGANDKHLVYPYHDEVGSETNISTFTVKDRIRYVVRRQSTGEVVTVLFNEFDGYKVPFTFDYSGNSTPDGDYDTFVSPPADLMTITLAQTLSLPGIDWIAQEDVILASHEETSSFTSKSRQINRFIFINFQKLKSENPNVTSFTLDVTIQFLGPPAQQGFGVAGMFGIYNKTVDDQVPAPPPINPAWKFWPVVSGVDPTEIEDFPNGGPYFFPPNDEAPPDNEHDREPLSEVSFDYRVHGTGESISAEKKIRFTINLENTSVTSEVLDATAP